MINILFDNRTNEIIEESVIDLIKKSIEATLKYEEFDDDSEISFSFVTKEEIKSLNKKYREIDRETDVLSFPLDDELNEDIVFLGDIILCYDIAKEQALEFKHSMEREIAFLSVHSTLHLLGYDHLKENEEVEMSFVQDEIMEKLKITRG